MRAVIQRVSQARVVVEGRPVGEIDRGLLVYVGVAVDDDDGDVAYLANKVRHLRVFPDEHDKMNLDVTQVGGSCLVVSAFTTQGDARKGHRPAYTAAAPPERAELLYDAFCAQLRAAGVPVATGRFQARMAVHAVNDGPICVLVDTRKTF